MYVISARVVTKSCEPQGSCSEHEIINHQVRIVFEIREDDGLEATRRNCVSDTR